MAIDYTKIDQDEVKAELITLLKQTDTFKNANFVGTALHDFVNSLSYVSSLYGFYLNQIANEPFIDSAKQFKNINRIASSLMYNPVGLGSAKVNIGSSLSKDYVLNNTEGFIEIPSYTLFPSNVASERFGRFGFTNVKTMSVQVKQFGVSQVRQENFKYNGKVLGSNLEVDKMFIEAFTKNPIHFIDANGAVSTHEDIVKSSGDANLINFKVNTEYSLFFRNGQLVVGNKTTEIQDDEISRFKISSKRVITFTQTFTNNRLYKGRLGFKNLEYVKVRAIPYPGAPGSVGKMELVVPQDVPAFQVLYKGEIFNFSSDRELIIRSEDIPGSFFDGNTDVSVVLDITNPLEKDYGAKLILKKPQDLLNTDVVIAEIPANNTLDARGNLLVNENEFLQGDSASGVLSFESDETVKRVVFETPFDFGLPTPEIPSTSAKNYAIYMYANDTVRTFYTNKTTRGFNIHVEDAVGFEGDIMWKVVAYEKNIVQSMLIDSTEFLGGIDPTNYSLILQPSVNANVWVREASENNFIIDSDVAFIGEVDFMVVEDKDFRNAPEPKEVGQVFVPKEETEVVVLFNTPRTSADYQVFLQASDNVNVWPIKKSIAGFVIKIEKDTDFSGAIDWQAYESAKAGTTFFGGAQGYTQEPNVTFVDLPETTNLGLLEQGVARLTMIDETGLVNTLVNSMNADIIIDQDIYPGLNFRIKEATISYNNIQVFVEDVKSGTWVEYSSAEDYRRPIDELSNVFYVRVDKDGYITVRFGNDDFRGKDPKGSKIAIIGLDSVGTDGNIEDGMLSSETIPSLNFQVSDIVTDQVFKSLLDLLRIKESVFRGGQSIPIQDYRGQSVSADDFQIIQLDKGYGGTNPEGIEDIRVNSQFSYRSQNRLVTKEDYEKSVLANFKSMVESVSVFNYKEIDGTGLFDLGKEPSRYFNTLFFLMVPTFGKGFTFLQRKTIKSYLDEKTRKVTGIDSVILEPNFVEIDVVVLYSVAENSSPIIAQNDLYSSIYSFFDRGSRALGETITVSQLRNAIQSEHLSGLEIQLKRDEDDLLSAADYDVDIKPDEYEDAFEEVAAKKLDDAVKRELRNLIGKGVVEIKQPLFDVQKENGEREWLFVNDVALGKFEFPVLGDIVIERKV